MCCVRPSRSGLKTRTQWPAAADGRLRIRALQCTTPPACTVELSAVQLLLLLTITLPAAAQLVEMDYEDDCCKAGALRHGDSSSSTLCIYQPACGSETRATTANAPWWVGSHRELLVFMLGPFGSIFGAPLVRMGPNVSALAACGSVPKAGSGHQFGGNPVWPTAIGWG